MGEKPAKVVPILMADLGSWEAVTRRLSANLLGRFGDAAKEAVPALLQTLQDSDETVREAALKALQKIDPETAAKNSPQQ